MPQGLENQLISSLQTFITGVGWIGIIIIMAIESANIPIPSEITMPLAGWILVQQQGGTALQAILLGGTLGALGCLIGSVINYWLGAKGGRPLVERYGKYILVSHKDIARADKWFARWGDWAAFISRLLPVVRTFISFPAGLVRINFVRFVIFTFVGSFIWCAALAFAGYAAGANFKAIRDVMRPFDYPIIALILIGLAYYIYRHVRHARQDAEEAVATAE